MLQSFIKVNTFQKDLDFFFSKKSAIMYIKGFSGILKLNMPSTFFHKSSDISISFLFSNKFFYKSFIRHLLVFSII